MSEKMYIRLLRLYPSTFRKEYEVEALQLIRDRLCDEAGFFKRARLWWDLVTDLLVGLPQAYRNSYASTETISFSPNADGIPSFKVLDKEPLRRGSILVGGTVSLTAIAAFGFVLSRPVAYLPISGSNGRISPTESVLEQLNRATTSDTAVSGAQEAAESTSAGAREQQPRFWPTAAANVSKPETATLLSESKREVSEQDRVVPIRTQNPNEHSSYLVESPKPSGALAGDRLRTTAT